MALTQPKGVQKIDSSQFETYAAQDAEKTVVDWGQAAVDLTKGAEKERDRRTKLKDDIETQYQEIQSSIDQYADKYQSLGTYVLEGAQVIKEQVLHWNQMLKNRDITPGEYKVMMNRTKEQIANMGIAAKNWDADEAKSSIRAQNTDLSKTGAEGVANATEIAIKNSTYGFRNLKNTKQIMTPDGNLYQVRLIEDPKCSAADKTAGKCKMVMPNFVTQNDMYLPYNNINARVRFEGNAATTDIGYQVNLEKGQFGTFMDATLRSYTKDDKTGLYIMSEEGMSLIKTSAEYDTVVKDVTNTIINGAYTEDADGNMVLNINAVDSAGLANAAAGNGGAYKIATSVEQFKRENPGLDKKFMILVNPNAEPPTYIFSDKKGALDHVVNKVKREMDQQLDQKVRMTTPSLTATEVKENTAEVITGQQNQAMGSYFKDLKNTVGGSQAAFDASAGDLMDRANERLAADKGNTDGLKIIDINREKNFITVVKVDSKGNKITEKIDRYETDDEGGYTDVKISDSIIFQKLNTELRPNEYKDESYEEQERRAIEGGFSFDYDDEGEGAYYGDETVVRSRAYKEISHDPLKKKIEMGIEDGDMKYVNYVEGLSKQINASGYGNQVKQMQTALPTEISAELKTMGIDIDASNFTITSEDVNMSPNNNFTIEITDPYTGRIIRETFTFASAKNTASGVNNVLVAMDAVINLIISGSNETKGKIKKVDEEDTGGAPTD